MQPLLDQGDKTLDNNVDNTAYCWFGNDSISENMRRVSVLHKKGVFEEGIFPGDTRDKIHSDIKNVSKHSPSVMF